MTRRRLPRRRWTSLSTPRCSAKPDDREDARWLIWEIGQAVGVQPSSIHDLYRARGRGLTGGFTVPAMNIRGMAYDTGRALFRAAIKLKVGALIQEIARSEIAYTDQRPAEYVAVMLAAALREGFRGPIFIQGDHFQVSAKKFAVDPVTEVNGVKQLAARGDSGRLLQHRRRYFDPGRPLQADAQGAATNEFRAGGRAGVDGERVAARGCEHLDRR